ncbi:MAG: XTP/dITP diphosphatase [Firmicutes bacterium]|nr:XTP/dITP diphosphatase [Bacillota bacterium]
MRRLVLATRNKGKIREIKAILADLPVEILDLGAYPEAPEVVEGGDFAANAQKKALAVAAHTGEWSLADDSGLEVEALGGAPGVFSARYAGVHGDDAANIAKLLAAMEAIPDGRRQARFVCWAALAGPDGSCILAEGECRGEILRHPRGTHGFGYDPVFFLPAYGRTMAELPEEVKNRISHRAQALIRLRPELLARFHGG